MVSREYNKPADLLSTQVIPTILSFSFHSYVLRVVNDAFYCDLYCFINIIKSGEKDNKSILSVNCYNCLTF